MLITMSVVSGAVMKICCKDLITQSRKSDNNKAISDKFFISNKNQFSATSCFKRWWQYILTWLCVVFKLKYLLCTVCCLLLYVVHQTDWTSDHSVYTCIHCLLHTFTQASPASTLDQPTYLCSEMLINIVRSLVSVISAGGVRGKASLPVCLWGDTTIMSMRPSTLASTVSLLRPVCLSTRWMDLVCQSVQ